MVLILVLVEDGLGDEQKCSIRYHGTVLILVLLEDGLVELQIYNFFFINKSIFTYFFHLNNIKAQKLT